MDLAPEMSLNWCVLWMCDSTVKAGNQFKLIKKCEWTDIELTHEREHWRFDTKITIARIQIGPQMGKQICTSQLSVLNYSKWIKTDRNVATLRSNSEKKTIQWAPNTNSKYCRFYTLFYP